MELEFSIHFKDIDLQNKMSEFKTILQQKAFDFNEKEKEKTGFYYLLTSLSAPNT